MRAHGGLPGGGGRARKNPECRAARPSEGGETRSPEAGWRGRSQLGWVGRTAAIGSSRAARHAGYRPNNTPTTIDTPKKREIRDKMFAQKYEATSKAYLQEIRKAAMIEYR